MTWHGISSCPLTGHELCTKVEGSWASSLRNLEYRYGPYDMFMYWDEDNPLSLVLNSNLHKNQYRSSVHNGVHLHVNTTYMCIFFLCEMYFQCFGNVRLHGYIVWHRKHLTTLLWKHGVINWLQFVKNLHLISIWCPFLWLCTNNFHSLPCLIVRALESSNFLSCLSIAGDQCNILRHSILLSIQISITISLKSVPHLLYITVST